MLRSRLQLREKLKEKLVEALQAVLPIVAIVLVLSFFIAPLSPSVLLCFLLGAVMIIFGMMFFTLGAEMSMTPMGERVGSAMTKSRSLPKMIVIGFILGFIITISEPDLQVLANQVPSVPNLVLILSVAAGVGAFLVIALLRMLFSMALPPLLVTLYAIVFVLAAFVPKDFLAVAFDSGGVTTGPMTVPFIMALGVGISAIRSDRHAADDSFGLVALCSIGPILAVLILGIAYSPGESSYTAAFLPDIQDSVELWDLFMVGLPAYFKEIALSLLPIMVFFGVYQFAVLRMSRKALGKILVGLFYTYIGLVLFLTGANVGFMPAATTWPGSSCPALPLGTDPPWYADWLFHRQGRARRVCAEQAGGGSDRWFHFRQGNGDQPFHRRSPLRWVGHAAGADRHFHLVDAGTGLRHRHRAFFLRSQNFYRHRV